MSHRTTSERASVATKRAVKSALCRCQCHKVPNDWCPSLCAKPFEKHVTAEECFKWAN